LDLDLDCLSGSFVLCVPGGSISFFSFFLSILLRYVRFPSCLYSYPGSRTLEAGMLLFVSRHEDNGT